MVLDPKGLGVSWLTAYRRATTAWIADAEASLTAALSKAESDARLLDGREFDEAPFNHAREDLRALVRAARRAASSDAGLEA